MSLSVSPSSSSSTSTSISTSSSSSSPSSTPTPQQREEQHSACVKLLKKSLDDGGVKLLLSELQGFGVAFETDCKPCEEDRHGYYMHVDDKHKIVLCEDRTILKSQFLSTLKHEMIHLFDNSRMDINPRNCRHVACTEIRAAALSGECTFFLEFLRGKTGPLSFMGHFQDCVRRRAKLSLEQSSTCSTKQHAVDQVWDHCFNDTAPWDKHP